MNSNVRKVIEVAKSWDRKNIHHAPSCPQDTCAFFVRYVFRQALHQAGMMPIAHIRPYYTEHKIEVLSTNENFADGFAGDVIGVKVAAAQVQAGDILLFKDTFTGDFPAGSITHVGIALDSHGLMADSSNGLCHVRNHQLIFPGKLVEVRRPRCLGADSNGVGLTLEKGQVLRSGGCREIKIKFGKVIDKKAPFMGVLSKSDKMGTKPHVFVDGREIRYQYITVDIALSGGNGHIKLFHHDGQTSAYSSGRKAVNLEVIAKLQNGLHVWADGKEVKPSAINIGIS